MTWAATESADLFLFGDFFGLDLTGMLSRFLVGLTSNNVFLYFSALGSTAETETSFTFEWKWDVISFGANKGGPGGRRLGSIRKFDVD